MADKLRRCTEGINATLCLLEEWKSSTIHMVTWIWIRGPSSVHKLLWGKYITVTAHAIACWMAMKYLKLFKVFTRYTWILITLYKRCPFSRCSVVNSPMPHLECGNSMGTIYFSCKNPYSKMPICHDLFSASQITTSYEVCLKSLTWSYTPLLNEAK